MRQLYRVLLVLTIAAPMLRAQTASSTPQQPATSVFSMGQPPAWLPYASALGVMSGGRGAMAGSLGVQRFLLDPITGLLAFSGEVVGEWRGGSAFGDVRALLQSPGLGIGFGADWRPQTHSIAPVISIQGALRRGGLVTPGSMVRLDWLPGRRHAVDLGFQFPLMQPFAGRTRPRRMTAVVPRAISAAVRSGTTERVAAAELALVDTTAHVISAFINPYPAADESTLVMAARRPYGRSFDLTSRAYVGALARAFGVAAGDSSRGDEIAARARAAMFDEAILPYDALFGQIKEGSVFEDMLQAARQVFARWASDSTRVSPASEQRLLAVFDSWSGTLDDVHRHLSEEWKDSRLIWLAPQLALAPEQYDQQAQVDSLIGRVVGHPFTDRNAIGYLRTPDLTVEVARSILAARKYHVLWVHDFIGRRTTGVLDDVSFTMVADAYLPALTAAVARYDSTGIFPEYFILCDAYYYHTDAGSVWFSILENPLGARMKFRKSEEGYAAHLRERVDSLRAAVARSVRLQREAAAHGGARWLAQVVKVNVSVSLPSDFSFRSARLAPPIPITPDNVARDHRKLVFYDLDETDPYAGELLASGIGIGEHYASATWEDRGFRLRGPAALEVRAALRRMLKGNGFRDEQIPPPLRVATGPLHAPSAADVRQSVARVLQVHNEPGFGPKRAAVARAMLYSLTPSGSVVVVPDPLWLSESWAGMLAGAAARGSTVAIIAPAKANAPSPEAPVIALERGILQRLLVLRSRIAALPADAAVSEALGEDPPPLCCSRALHVGIYAGHASVADVTGRLRETRAGLARAPWIRDVIPFDSSALAVLDRATVQAGHADAVATSIAQDEKPRDPQLHQKTQLIARPGAIAALLRQPGWDDVLAQNIRDQAQQSARLADAIGAPIPPADTAAARAADQRLQGYQRSLSPSERKRLTFYFALGSFNHDLRGQALDGEASVIVSGFDGSAGLVDLFYLMTRTTWIDSDAEIDRLVPAPSRLMARLAHLVRFAM
jgi:hypothetical protein